MDADPVEVAEAARLRHVGDDGPGIRRIKKGAGSTYVDPAGRRVTDEATLARIRSLAIPPAWTDVWICPIANGHLQARGRDARGRKQYRYHARWSAVRDATKYERMAAFGAALPRIRARVARDLGASGLSKEKVLALVVRLLERTAMRVGNEEYARTNGSYGLTTLRDRHVEIAGSKLRFRFRGKSGKQHDLDVDDARVARMVKRCRELPGQDLFQWLDDEGEPHAIDSGDVNDYLREAAGTELTAKDFRTWEGTLLAARCLARSRAHARPAEARRACVEAIASVAEALGNTPAVCKKGYVHPTVLATFEDAELLRLWRRHARMRRVGRGLSREERALLAFLAAAGRVVRRRARATASTRARDGGRRASASRRTHARSASRGRARSRRPRPSRRLNRRA